MALCEFAPSVSKECHAAADRSSSKASTLMLKAPCHTFTSLTKCFSTTLHSGMLFLCCIAHGYDVRKESLPVLFLGANLKEYSTRHSHGTAKKKRFRPFTIKQTVLSPPHLASSLTGFGSKFCQGFSFYPPWKNRTTFLLLLEISLWQTFSAVPHQGRFASIHLASHGFSRSCVQK